MSPDRNIHPIFIETRRTGGAAGGRRAGRRRHGWSGTGGRGTGVRGAGGAGQKGWRGVTMRGGTVHRNAALQLKPAFPEAVRGPVVGRNQPVGRRSGQSSLRRAAHGNPLFFS